MFELANYLITWNPKRFEWDTIEEDIMKLEDDSSFIGRWSCGGTKRIKKGDRIFTLRQGLEPRGIMASGWATCDVYQDEHWSGNGEDANYIKVRYDTILNPQLDEILERKMLDQGILSEMHWDTQGSGISIRGDIALELEELWIGFSESRRLLNSSHNNKETAIEFVEGSPITVNSKRYERNRVAREMCIEHYGCSCSVCNFNFESIYGDVGKGFIHVHHVVPMAERATEYNLNPIRDLRPVCPNCHAMIHKTNPCMTIKELKGLL